MKKTELLLIAVLVAAMLDGSANAQIITPTAAVASTEFHAVVGPGHLIDPSHLDASNQHIARAWGGNWLASDGWKTEDNWVYIDLGASCDLDEIRVWNYHEDAGPGIPELMGRGVKACSIWVAPEGVTLPTLGTAAAGFTTATGWTRVWAGELNAGPSTVAPVADIGPTNVFDATGQTSVRYVGIDIGGRWGQDPYTKNAPGLSYIQVTGQSSIAHTPVPRDTAQTVQADKPFCWTKPGLRSPSGYEVYFSSDRHKVAAGDVSVKVTASDADGDAANTQYTPASALSDATEYFWRVDSIVDGKAIPGQTWSFRTRIPTGNLGSEGSPTKFLLRLR